MSRLLHMADAVTVSRLPHGQDAYAGYVNGHYANIDQIAHAFPHAHHLPISVNAEGVADCLDVESGDATPAQAGPWVARMIRDHHVWRPCVYAAASAMRAVESSLQHVGLARGHYRLWIALWNGEASVPAGYDAHQYLSTTGFDLSVCLPSFFPSLVQRVEHTVTPAPKPHTFELPSSSSPIVRGATTIHPKVIGSTAGATLGIVLTAILHAAGVHGLTPAESAAISTLSGAIGGYITPAR